MPTKLETFIKSQLKTDLPDIRPGDTILVSQKIREGDKERIQDFEGLVIARKHGKEAGATITVRKVILGIGVERIFPLHSPTIKKVEILKRGRVRRAKLYYLRKAKGKKAKLKRKEFTQVMSEEIPIEEKTEGAGNK
ncbi:MAG: 50S ribosomal protein L19 [Parcubacteria group bacterium CG2_30_36_18]|uniref:Large ribosomal subunit protein bL19 n=1 Tax=Candidatus Nealsonbacteria bacterium CG_4_10_14_3_um_filter_36_16 TaxID=1974685 RepID=A0A2M7MF69_9BACT|nr:MAG: 50S ribosomal protein L19 [Parcubacteria group bacterium CG2_30_36_18]PIX88331.1 MAG: 50S ribosomal protein L19 [Candidatus Nealsonbacteria bacterium CG_4_10_14_3_um_filter_36_16]